MKAIEPTRRKRLFFYALLCTCVGIWGFVLYEVVRGLGQADEALALGIPSALPAPTSAETVSRLEPGYVYQDDFRDPFALPASLFPAPRKQQGTKVTRPEPEPLPFSLSGIVDGTALLHGAEGSSYVVREGEHAAGARLLKVRPDHVVLRYEGRSVTLRLHQ